MQKFLKNNNYFSLVIILLIAAFLRFYGLNWDQGHGLHPDERAIIMFTSPIALSHTFNEFMSPQSPLNPHFFAYGNFPLYLLKIVSSLASNFDLKFATYDGMFLVGRVISAIADLGTIALLFFIGKRLGNKILGLFASFLYALAVFPIQASHFFAVDILLTFFITLTLYRMLALYEKRSLLNALLVGICFGLSLATKISALVLLVPILATVAVDFRLTKTFFRRIFQSLLPIALATVVTFIVTQPYAIIDSKNFIEQNLQQSQMTKSAYTFPYTLQYVGKIPYIYEIKNVFFWGFGPVFASLAFIGVFYSLWDMGKKFRQKSVAREFILLSFFIVYFGVVGKFAVGWMRYMLPLYPLFCLFAAVLFLRILKFLPDSSRIILTTLYLILIFIWPLSFIHIYTKPHTRVAASNWIKENIPAGSTLAVEHWDDQLPLFGSEKYKFVAMTLYELPDDDKKWAVLNQKLAETNYIILASNRLYIPLPKLADCTKYKVCYPKVTEYYKKLFSGELGFQKVAEFTSFPTIPVLNIPIDDQGADEAFTVYDHPEVIIFKKS